MATYQTPLTTTALGNVWAEIGDEVMQHARVLATHSEAGGAMTRTYLTPQHHAAASQITDWMRDAGMSVRRDAAGNVIGRYEGNRPSAAAILTGSHFDTVRNGGIFDGILGVILPIACIRAWHRAGRRFPHTIDVIGFAEEEGVRFGATLLGSRAIAGTFDTRVLDNTDDAGTTMREAIDTAGLGFDHRDLPRAAYGPESVAAFVEVHIEQGPVLLNEGLALGVVTAIAGATRYMVDVKGEAGHAGTIPMNLRRDAAMAAAEMALFIEHRCRSVDGLMGTVGQLIVPGGATNVVPGRAQFSIDIRSGDDAVRETAATDVEEALVRIGAWRGVEVQVRKVHEAPSVPCAAWLQAQWEATLRQLGMPVRYLASGAGHDAMAMASLTDVAMLFVRCGNGGVSHSPLEIMTAADAAAAATAFSHFVEHFEPSRSGASN